MQLAKINDMKLFRLIFYLNFVMFWLKINKRILSLTLHCNFENA